MEREQIEQSLNKKFEEALRPGEKRKIVFWYDTEGQFTDLINELHLEPVKVHQLTEHNYFYTKYLLEVKDTASNYLIYANHRPARDEDNWLIDTLLYSYEFYADRLVLQMEELGIPMSLRPQVKRYEKFFKNAERRKRLASYKEWSYAPAGSSPRNVDYNETTLEIAMMSVLCGLKYADQQQVYKKVLGSSIKEENNPLSDISRFMDEEVFWKHASKYFGYTRQEHSLSKLAAHILINSLRRTLDDKYLQPFKEYLADYGKGNCIYFVDHWMNNQKDNDKYEALSAAVDKTMGIAERIDSVPIEELKECDGFESFDQKILRYIRESISNQVENYEFCLNLIKARRTKHWYYKYESIYESLYHLLKILDLKKTLAPIPMIGPKEIWENYARHYFLVDYHYRNFYCHYDRSPVEFLKNIRALVENIYSNWFLQELGIAWSQALESSPRIWQVEGVVRQQHFYQHEIEPIINAGDRCFVVISDALRYEAAMDIAIRLNQETVATVNLDTMLGVLPSTTPYGMAALLPHQQLSLNEKQRVLADSRKTDSLQEREQVLQHQVPDAVAVHYQTLIDMNKGARRELVKGKKLVYIYHDSIDVTGHAAEVKVFDAVGQSLEEIYRLIRLIRDDLGGINIFVTADHGFLYRRDPLPETDKMKKEMVAAFEEKRRYLLSYEEVENDALMLFKPDYISSDVGALCVYVPRSAIRFKVQGPGANFVHGGATLQEVMVPLIKYKALRGSNRQKKEKNKVKLKLINESRKISNTLFSLEFFQTEKVDEGRLPRTVEVYLEDENGKIISNREMIIADKCSDKPAERSHRVRMTLKSGPYDKQKDYFLMVRDVDTELIEGKIPFKINIAFSSDFDF
ncbi:MAG TPA: BREX-1 system phosphatase PglZ type A [Gelria sp.]|jgi:uncharacterized protein (TIGR02687 family)|nr:BREX-1 system phosphatase PglZ type A [Gelria sp.]